MYSKTFIFAAITLMLGIACIFGQGTTGGISGTVTDPNGAVVAGISVKATNTATNYSRQTTTDSDGIYGFQLLPVGQYLIEISGNGFQHHTARATVNISQTTTVNVQMGVGIDAGSVTIDAGSPEIQIETSQQGRTVTGDTLSQLPLPTRNFQQVLTLSTGAQAAVSNTTDLGRGDAIISVNGQRTTSNSVKINGIDANSIGTNSTPNIAVPATDALQEFIVQTSMYDASNGRNAGGNVEAITKSGTNKFHGDAYYFLRRTGLNANDPFVKAQGTARPVLNRDQYGVTLGGPVVKDKVFFFGSYQGTNEKNGASLTNSLTNIFVPAGLTDSNRTAAGLAATFGLPQAYISPRAVAILNAKLPDGSFAIPSSGVTGLSANTPVSVIQSGLSTFKENQFNANGDFNFSSKHTLAAKFFIADNPTKQANYNFAGIGNGPNQLVGFGGDLTIKQKLYSITDSYVFTPNIVNQAKFGFSRIRVTSVPDEPISASSVGMTSSLSSLYAGLPTISFAGSDSLFFAGSSPLADQSSRINAYSFGDTLSWTHGNHRLKFGGEYRFSQVKFYFNAFSRGEILYTDGGGLPAFDNFLTANGLGAGYAATLIGSGVFDRYYKVQDWNGFVQDDWKVTKRLTVNLGLRYDLLGLPYEASGRLVNFIPGTQAIGNPPNGIVQAEGGSLAGVPTVDKHLVPTDKDNFAPRVGFAYDVLGNQKVVIRGGYGIYYDRISTRYANTQLFNFPYLAIGVGLVNNTYAPFNIGFRSDADPFVHLPLPSAFPTAATIPSPLSSSVPILGVPISGVWVDPDLQTPYVQQYNLGAQFQLPGHFVLDAGYVGNKGTHLLQVLTLNQPVYSGTNGSVATYPLGSSTVFAANKNLTGGMQQVSTSSLSHYDSLQFSLSKRFSSGLQFLASYTHGVSIDYYSGGTVNELVNTPGDQWNWRTNRGPSDFNREDRFVVSGVYDLPNAVSKDNAAKWLVNDWQIAGIAVFQSGLPYSIVDSNGTTIISRANIASGFTGNPDGTGDPETRLNRYFNTSAFVTSRPGTATFDAGNPFGNTQRNLLVGPGQKNVDISLIKVIPFTERVKGQFRAEFFNAFNWVNYANPGSTISSAASFGRITSASSGPRVIQFAFKVGF